MGLKKLFLCALHFLNFLLQTVHLHLRPSSSNIVNFVQLQFHSLVHALAGQLVAFEVVGCGVSSAQPFDSKPIALGGHHSNKIKIMAS